MNEGNPFNIEDFVFIEELTGEISRGKKVRLPKKMLEPFVPNVPLPWFRRAAISSGKSLHIALVIWREAVMKRSRTVKLPNKELAGCGVGPNAKRRGLHALGSQRDANPTH